MNGEPAALTRFWFPIPGHLGIGVTAPSLAEATQMAASVADGHGWTLDARLVEQNVDVLTLRLVQQGPNVRTSPDRKGIWFP